MSKAITKKPETDFVAHEEGILDIKDLVVMGEGGKPMTDSLKVARGVWEGA